MAKISRRSFLLMTGGAGAALAAGPGQKAVNTLIPYVTPPENIPIGEWSSYATTCRECPAGCGMHMLHRDGRITKVEGNREHPISRGGLCPRGQSAAQGLYDPDRIRHVILRDGNARRKATWHDADAEIASRLRRPGVKVTVVSELQTGALEEVMNAFAASFRGTVLMYEPFNHEALRSAHRLLFNTESIPRYRLEECDFIISFGADFLETWVSPVEYADRFSKIRSLHDGIGRMIYVGPQITMTAANADHVIMVPPGTERYVALGMLKIMMKRRVVSGGRDALRAILRRIGNVDIHAVTGIPEEKLAELAEEFSAARKAVALAGPILGDGRVSTDTAAAAALLNYAAGQVGKTVDFSSPHAISETVSHAKMSNFLRGIGPNDVVIINNTNIAFTRPDSIDHLRRAGLVVYLGTLPDETSEIAHWTLPIDNHLETWGDYEPYNGIHSLMQPGMAKLYNTRSPGDCFLELGRSAGKPLTRGGQRAANFEEWLKGRWSELQSTIPFAQALPAEIFWQQSLRNGGVWQEKPGITTKLSPTAAAYNFAAYIPSSSGALHLWASASVMLYDGRIANRSWMQEAPHPISTVVWGNWLDLHLKTAEQLGLKEGDVAELKTAGGSVQLPVRVSQEVMPGVAAVQLGQGHWATGLRVAHGHGANPFILLSGKTGDIPTQVAVYKTGKKEKLVTLSATADQHHRHILKWIPFSKVRRLELDDAEEIILPLPEGYQPERDLYPRRKYTQHRWAMVVDLQKCIGCGACAIACYAENNIPVVGKEKASKGREMAWLKVVPYRKEDESSRMGWLPMLCQQCDAAPCEPVCPVFASVHNEEGLNAQIYNRCIGTRYCSNNCPYKVRRFNWFDTKWEPPLQMQLNPEVTVRSRGVMEKCTFCVQRIRHTEYRAKREKRKIRDGEIQPACVQSCPAHVYTFGDLLDADAQVTKLIRTERRRYQVLNELNTKTAVIYLKRVIIDEI